MITLTPNAVQKILEIREQHGSPDSMVRVWVAGIGCSGMQYGMGFADSREENDTAFESDGLTVLIDPDSLTRMTGSTIDVDDVDGQPKFRIENPNDAGCSSCGGGCGSSQGCG